MVFFTDRRCAVGRSDFDRKVTNCNGYLGDGGTGGILRIRLRCGFSMAGRYAFFDLDHTLLPHDTQALFCNFVLRREGARRLYLFLYLLAIPLHLVRILDLRTMKRVFACYLWRMPRERLEAYVEEFVDGDFAESLYPEVVEEVERHREKGRLLVLNSASPEFYLARIADRLGFDRCIGTRMIVEDRMPLFPRIEGPNNKSDEKITAMIDAGILPEDWGGGDGAELLPDSWSYSDSSADIPLLSIAEHGVMIHPGEKLEAAGLERGWRTLTPKRPYREGLGSIAATLRQVVGAYRVGKS